MYKFTSSSAYKGEHQIKSTSIDFKREQIFNNSNQELKYDSSKKRKEGVTERMKWKNVDFWAKQDRKKFGKTESK